MKRKHILVLIGLAIIIAITLVIANADFLFNRFRDRRTVESVVNKYEGTVLKRLKLNFSESGITYDNLQIAILAFKQERIVLVYARNDKNSDWRKFKTYEFTAFSGKIGPKLKEGDRQIPEGIYRVESLNPNSSYHLSLRVNYPNEFDKAKGKIDGRAKLGGDIMIHGKNVTIGCIPIGDENIEELFVLSARSYKHGIPVIISPVDFRDGKGMPDSGEIEWEEELNASIREELKKFR